MKLEVQDLRKSFEGNEVLHGVSFSIESGRALGLLGRNGAGKTTTIRILMDVFKANAGEMKLDGKEFHPKDYKIGYLPEERGLYPKKKVKDQLIYLAQLRGMDKKSATVNLDKWLKRLHIEEYKNRDLDTLSKGNQQKVQLAQSVMCDPDIVILDEPFSGLDPVNSQVLKDVVLELIQDGKLVIFSSHQMNYVEEFCEDILILHHGDVVLAGNLKQIKKDYGKNRLVLSALNYTPQDLKTYCEEHLQAYFQVFKQNMDYLIIELKEGVTKDDVLRKLLDEPIDIEKFMLYEASLNDIFVEKAGDEK